MDGTLQHPLIQPAPDALLLDAMGTLVRLDHPVDRLAEGLRNAGWTGPAASVEPALRAEIRFYRRSLMTGRDAPSLERLRDAAVRELAAHLPSPPPHDALRPLLLDALRIVPHPDARRLLVRCRAGGVPVVVVSNWDVGLAAQLAACGLGPLVAGVVTSAAVGVEKPHPGIFRAALARLPASRRELVLHCGDDPERDRFGARALGLAAALIDRRGAHPGVPDRVTSLDELADRCGLPPINSSD